MKLAGIDIGTTSIGIVIVSSESGKTELVAIKANDAQLPSERSWERAQNPERIVEIVRELISGCGPAWSDVSAIGVSCQMHGMLYVDRSGRSVSPLFTWQDGRGDLMKPDSADTYADHLSKLTRHPMSSGFGLTTHYYNVLNDEVPADAAALCSIGDYVAMQLTGTAIPLIDASNAASFGLFSNKLADFDADAVARSGMNAAILPPVCAGTGIAGITPDGKQVACAIGDNQASFIGSVPDLIGTMLLNIGTGSQMSAYTEELEEIPGLETRPFPGGGFLLVGAPLSGGKSYALLEQFFKSVCLAFGGGTEAKDQHLYERMNALAEEVLNSPLNAGLGQLRVGTQFYGTRQDPFERGHIAGLSADNFTPGYLAAGVLTGIVDELMGFVHLLPENLRASLNKAAGAGNGIRRNAVMQRLLRERLKLPLHLAEAKEEACFGAAIYAAAAAGAFPDIHAAMAAMKRG
ncbi:sedoheptulokinase [Paenibacillus taihuensis]|uniref:Sedoheptulokinase n=1 Tax=Paenibacillus taihuensis TaxID=1156355 RepID=A0A3D9SCX8_9BACL|nr:FGGY family carbohydrate kinase [Paenibacillus taihuensis]REE92716.1 sedoheptulokinase [Paenibacillus taihuensis]